MRGHSWGGVPCGSDCPCAERGEIDFDVTTSWMRFTNLLQHRAVPGHVRRESELQTHFELQCEAVEENEGHDDDDEFESMETHSDWSDEYDTM